MSRYIVRNVSYSGTGALMRRLEQAHVTLEGACIMASKADIAVMRVEGIGAPAANILKQQLLSLGGDAAVHSQVIRGEPESSTAFIIADGRRLRELPARLESQPFGLGELGRQVAGMLDLRSNPPRSIPLPGGSIDIAEGPVIMGILNVTPDSFSDGGRYMDPSEAVDRACRMVEEGAGIIDVGGESSRPGSSPLTPGEELERLGPVLERLKGAVDVPISIDTRKGSVARAAIEAGASMINDISGLRDDPGIVDAAAASGAAVVVMHMLGTPETMQDDPSYSDAVAEIVDWLEDRIETLVPAGISRDKIIVDPGIGFGKRLQDNLDIIDRAGDFHTLGAPVLFGFSRKSFLGSIGGGGPGERLAGGLAVLGCCLEAGIQMVRVHDVRETREYIEAWKAVRRKDRER